jgi:hypothetical protein
MPKKQPTLEDRASAAVTVMRELLTGQMTPKEGNAAAAKIGKAIKAKRARLPRKKTAATAHSGDCGPRTTAHATALAGRSRVGQEIRAGSKADHAGLSKEIRTGSGAKDTWASENLRSWPALNRSRRIARASGAPACRTRAGRGVRTCRRCSSRLPAAFIIGSSTNEAAKVKSAGAAAVRGLARAALTSRRRQRLA